MISTFPVFYFPGQHTASLILNLVIIMLPSILAPGRVIADDSLCVCWMRTCRTTKPSKLFCTSIACKYKFADRLVYVTNCEYYEHVSGQASTLNVRLYYSIWILLLLFLHLFRKNLYINKFIFIRFRYSYIDKKTSIHDVTNSHTSSSIWVQTHTHCQPRHIVCHTTNKNDLK